MMFSLCLDQLAARLVHLACFLAWRLVVRLALLHDGEVLRHTTATSAGDAILAEQLFDVGHCVRLRRCVDANRLTGRAAERDNLTDDAAAAADGVGTTSAGGGTPLAAEDRTGVVQGKSVSGRIVHVDRSFLKKKK